MSACFVEELDEKEAAEKRYNKSNFQSGVTRDSYTYSEGRI